MAVSGDGTRGYKDTLALPPLHRSGGVSVTQRREEREDKDVTTRLICGGNYYEEIRLFGPFLL